MGNKVLGLLGVLFVGLKLCKIINWSWGLVTLPFWAGTALLLLYILYRLIFSQNKLK